MIIWLASYPKSGNTWLRSIICSILYSENGLFQFELLKKIKQFPSQDAFKDFTSEFNNINEIKKFWILAQEKINLNNEINFLKTHHINCKIDNYSFSNKSNTLATIYIVRDPRNLVNSISNHFSKSIEDSKNFLFTKKMLGTKEISFDDNDIYTLLGSWNDHYNYWTSKTENLLVLRYEDLVQNIGEEFDKITFFLKKYVTFEIDDLKKKNIINSTSFNNLQTMEEKGFFKESVFDKEKFKKKQFFYKGPQNNWQNNLDDNIRKEIEEKFYKEMKKLNYI
tara:strand:- start:335 stop:1174 length:840 start_codon:yes stop_codon:yes gene_type:complete